MFNFWELVALTGLVKQAVIYGIGTMNIDVVEQSFTSLEVKNDHGHRA